MSSYEVLDCENDTEGNFDQLAKDKNSINVENIESGMSWSCVFVVFYTFNSRFCDLFGEKTISCKQFEQ